MKDKDDMDEVQKREMADIEAAIALSLAAQVSIKKTYSLLFLINITNIWCRRMPSMEV